MGGGQSSIPPEEFGKLRFEYEQKKAEGFTDEQIFNHMKGLVEKIISPSAIPASSDCASGINNSGAVNP
jgi:hypothetical protein